jgi:rubredoxin
MDAYIPQDRRCPHCDSVKIQPIPRSAAHEAESIVSWFECLACQRIWHREKPSAYKGSRGNNSSPNAT